MNTLTVKELLTKDIDIDVYDDYDETIRIAFCGPMGLTDEGNKKFGDILDTEVKIYGDCAVICVNDDIMKLNKLYKLFVSLAGYCSNEDYIKWFVEV